MYANVLMAVMLTAPSLAAEPERIPILLDTDIGDDIDDAFALALALKHPKLELLGVTTAFGDSHTRALLACRFLHEVGRGDVPVAAGAAKRAKPSDVEQLKYGLIPVAKKPLDIPAVEFLYKQLKARPGELTVVAVGPYTNIAALFTKHPECKPWLKQLVLMGGALKVGWKDPNIPEPEWNVKQDIAAAKVVFSSGVPLLVAPLDATKPLALGPALREKLFKANTPLIRQIRELLQLWNRPNPVLFDPAALALLTGEPFFTVENLLLELDDKGLTRAVPGKPNARVATAVKAAEFLDWYVTTVSRK